MGFNPGLRDLILVEYGLIMFHQIFHLFFLWNFMGLNGISLNITLPMTPQFLSPARPPFSPGTSQCCCRAAGRDCDKIIRLSSRTGTVPMVYVAATIYETMCRIDKNCSSFVHIYIYMVSVCLSIIHMINSLCI